MHGRDVVMLRRMIVPMMFGVVGAAVLIGLGVWQVERLAWKQAVLADIDARIMAAPVDLPVEIDRVRDSYLPVRVTGRFTGEHVDVLVSRKQIGAGVRVVEVFEAEAAGGVRRVLVDRGFVPDEDRALPRVSGEAVVTGNLHWPSEVDGYTPPPDPKTSTRSLQCGHGSQAMFSMTPMIRPPSTAPPGLSKPPSVAAAEA